MAEWPKDVLTACGRIAEAMNSIEEDDSDYEDVSFMDFSSCPVCMDRYSLSEGQKIPIILQCHHSLCKACCLLLVNQARIQANVLGYLHRRTNIQIISCPVCRKRLQIRDGEYPVNFYITKFLEEMKKKRDLGPNLALWCKDCKCVAKEVCRLHSTVKLGDALCNLATNHKYISSTLLEIVSTYIESSKKSASDSDFSVKKLETSMGELRSFISKVKTFFRVLGTKKKEINATFTSCRDAISNSVEKTKTCEPFACNSDDLVQDSQTWLQSSKKVDDETLRDRARVVCQSSQIKLVKTLEEHIHKLQDQELAISLGKKLQDNFNKEQGQINSDFFKFECKCLIDKFKRSFDECFREINKFKVLNDIPNDRCVPFGKNKWDKPKLLAKELIPSLKYFIELIQAEKGTGSGDASASKVSTSNQKESNIKVKTTQTCKAVEFVISAPAESNIEITQNEDNNDEISPAAGEGTYYFPTPLDYDDDNAIDDGITVTTINDINKMTANFFEESQQEMPEIISNCEQQNNAGDDCHFLSRTSQQNHLLFPNPVTNTEVGNKLNCSVDLGGSDTALELTVRPEPERITGTKVKRWLDETRDHQRVKRVRSSITNPEKVHKRRVVKKRKYICAAEILNISSDNE